MWQNVLFIISLVSSVNAGVWNYVGNGCTGTRDTKFTEAKYTGIDVFIGAVKLVYKSGYVGCSTDGRRSNWGCAAHSTGLAMIVTDAKNQRIYPALRFSSTITEYGLPGFTSSSPTLVLADFANPLFLKNGDTLRVWYVEDLLDSSESDNIGSTCMDVYVYKMSI